MTAERCDRLTTALAVTLQGWSFETCESVARDLAGLKPDAQKRVIAALNGRLGDDLRRLSPC